MYRGKKVAKNVGYFCDFQKSTQNKESPNGQKLAQPGHPALMSGTYAVDKQLIPVLSFK
jgi:hypothetical protein